MGVVLLLVLSVLSWLGPAGPGMTSSSTMKALRGHEHVVTESSGKRARFGVSVPEKDLFPLFDFDRSSSHFKIPLKTSPADQDTPPPPSQPAVTTGKEAGKEGEADDAATTTTTTQQPTANLETSPSLLPSLWPAGPSPHPPASVQDLVDSNKNELTKYVLYLPAASGFGDRLRGLVASYYLALALNRHLIVENPCPSKELLTIPSELSSPFAWRRLPGRARFHFRSINTETSIFSQDFSALNHFPVISLTTNKVNLALLLDNPGFATSPARDSILSLRDQGKLWHTALHSSLLPGPKILGLLDQIEADHYNAIYFKVAIHVRTSDVYIMHPARKRPQRDIRSSNVSVPCYSHQVMKIWRGIPEEERKAKYPAGPKVCFVSVFVFVVLFVVNFSGGDLLASLLCLIGVRDL